MSGIRQRLSSFCTFIWNGEEKKFLGRGGRNWAEIGFFYLVYYTMLFGFFVGMLAVFYQTVDDNAPKLTGDASLLKANPGMGFQPMSDIESTLIRFRNDPSSYNLHIDSIQKVLKTYKDAYDANKGIDCANDTIKDPNVACRVDYPELTSVCNEGNKFGYDDEQKPCVLLRLNKIFDWMPISFDDSDLPNSGMSSELQVEYKKNNKLIWIECAGENAADKDNVGNITYHPRQGFPFYYYPYLGQKDYLSPVIFIKFNNLAKNIALMIECKALAKNVRYDRQDKEGGVHFEMLLDP